MRCYICRAQRADVDSIRPDLENDDTRAARASVRSGQEGAWPVPSHAHFALLLHASASHSLSLTTHFEHFGSKKNHLIILIGFSNVLWRWIDQKDEARAVTGRNTYK